MLGLRKSFASRRLRKRSTGSPSLDSSSDLVDSDTGEPSSGPAMSTIRAGLQESSAGLASKQAAKAPEVAVKPASQNAPVEPKPQVQSPPPVEEKRAEPSPAPLVQQQQQQSNSAATSKKASNGHSNGSSNGSSAHISSDANTTTRKSTNTATLFNMFKSTTTNGNSHATNGSSSSTVKATRVSQSTQMVRQLIAQLGDHSGISFDQVDLDSYLEFISDERLFHMPRRGSDWDRVLRAAQYFGLQLWAFGERIGTFSQGTEEASITGLGSCQILLEIGHHQAQALVPTFHALYELGIMISDVCNIYDLFSTPTNIKESIVDLYCDLVELVGDISVFYRKKISAMRPGQTATVKFDTTFGGRMSHIWERRDVVVSKVWRLKLGDKNPSQSLDSIRLHLKHERSNRGFFYDSVDESMKRAEDSCEWLTPYLIDFLRSKNKVFSVTGSEGCGKIFLAGWIRERLQSPLDHTQYHSLSYTFAYDSKSQRTPLAFLKGVLFQLLEMSIGDVDLYEKLSLSFENYSKDRKALEPSLWDALETGLRTLDSHHVKLVIIVNGLEDIPGEQARLDFQKTLLARIAKFEGVRAITFSNKSVPPLDEHSKHLSISPYHLSGDLKSYFKQAFSSLAGFQQMSAASQDQLVQDLVQKAKDSFIWAYLVVRLVARQTPASADAFAKACQSIPVELNPALDKTLAAVSLKNDVTRNMLAFMLVADRALMVSELAELLRLNLQKRESGADVNVARHIKQYCGDLLAIERGRVHFQSKAVRSYMLTLMGKSLPSVKEAHQMFTLALLLYSRLSLPSTYEPSPELINDAEVDHAFNAHGLLEYSVKHWLSHFRQSAFFDATKGQLTLTPGFGDFFPDSCLFVLLERAWWHSSFSTADVIQYHELALKVRETCFGEKHVTVLQGLILLAQLHVTTIDVLVGAKYFYRAAMIGKSIFAITSPVVVACTNFFLKYTDSMTITSRVEIVTYREQMILLIIDIYKAKSDTNSDVVIHWYETLVRLYTDIGEKERATAIYKRLLEIYVIRFGRGSPQVGDVQKYIGDLEIVLTGDATETDVVQYEKFFLETVEELDVADENRITVLLRLAELYESQKKWFLAEKVYISLWQRISGLCHADSKVELHISKLDIAIKYVRFLQRAKRAEDASSILLCLWVEYEALGFDDKRIVLRIREVGTLCKSVGLLQIAVAILNKVWGWFKGKGKDQATEEEAASTTVMITEVVEEITETTVSVKTTTVTTTERTEVLVKDVYQSHYERCKKSGVVDKVFFNSCLALISLYLKTESWAQAEAAIKQSLEISWKAVLTVDVSLKLTQSFTSESIRVAEQLAICYRRQGYFEKAEPIYVRIFRACVDSLKVDDAQLQAAYGTLITFYEEHRRYEKVLEIYTQLLVRYRKDLGASHKLTIQLLYSLASLYKLLGHRDEAFKYYIEIVAVLNKDAKVCHRDAFEAAVLLITYYHQEQRWAELQQVCTVLWESFVSRHAEYAFTEDVVQLLYEKYTYVLEVHAKVEFSVLYTISVRYRDTVKAAFGAKAAIVLRALIALAGICEKSEKHHSESVSIYEEVISRMVTEKTTTTTITETTVTTVKRRLAKVYVTIVSSGSAKPQSVEIERALTVSLEVYAQLRIEFGAWHEKTLLKLKDIVIIYQKMGGSSQEAKIVELLHGSFTNIITSSSCTTWALYQAAKTLAEIYISVGLVRQASSLVQQIRHLVIFGHTFDAGLQLTVRFDAKVSKSAFVFIVAFEQFLAGDSKNKVVLGYSELMARMLLELSLYEQYTRAVETKAAAEAVLEYGAQLRAFWVAQKAEASGNLVAELDKRLFAFFKTAYTASGALTAKTQDEHARLFLVAVLVELGRDAERDAPVNFATVVCRAANKETLRLLNEPDKDGANFTRAAEVARCAFYFSRARSFYHDVEHFRYAYQLAEYMAGIDVRHPADLKFMEVNFFPLSREIVAEVLAVFREEKMDLVRLKFEDLAGIVRLLGNQENFVEVEALLLALWRSREVQKTWSTARVLAVGRALVHAHARAGNLARALDLADILAYNLRRSRGALDPLALDMTLLLASLQTTAGQIASAAAVHEDVLRSVDAACRDEEDGETPDKVTLVALVRARFDLLRRAYARLGASGAAAARPETELGGLYARLVERLGDLQVPAPDAWAKRAAEVKGAGADKAGEYVPPKEWLLESMDSVVLDLSQATKTGIGAKTTTTTTTSTASAAATIAAGTTKSKRLDHVRLASWEWLVR